MVPSVNIVSADFVKSAAKLAHYPSTDVAEIAFAGRSNVGKSSLINTLVNRKRLVKTGSTPGRTQLINFFLINNAFHFVDLPGYGYAKVPAHIRKLWGPMVETFLQERRQLAAVVLLFDIRRSPGATEINFLAWLEQYAIPTVPVITKADKLSKSKQQQQLQQIARGIDRKASELILFSAKSRLGKNSLLDVIENLLTRHRWRSASEELER